MTTEELREMIAELTRSQTETDRQLKQTGRSLQETERLLREGFERTEQEQRLTEAQQRETSRQIEELKKQLGGLGDKFGSFTEGMALPAMTKLLEERFGMDVVSPRTRVRRNGHHLELDVLAYSNSGKNGVYVVEVKSHLREEGLQQMLRILEEFPDFFPSHRDKKLYGILACVDAPEDLQRRVLDHGIYLARIHDDLFELQVPEDFEPRSFQAAAEG